MMMMMMMIPKSTRRRYRILILYLISILIFAAHLREKVDAPQVWPATASTPSISNTTSTKNVIAYSLYGSNEQFWGGAVPNAELAAGYFPDWEVRFYHDYSVPEETLNLLKTLPNVKLYDMTNSSIVNPRAWRFLVALDPEITGAYILRDTDSRLTLREWSAVDEWLQSNYTFHNMHDHPHHCSHKMQAGMWGGKGMIPEMRCVLNRCDSENIVMDKYDDQKMLEKFVMPVVLRDVMHHDSFCCGSFDEICPSRPFPTARDAVTRDHVGSRYLPWRQSQMTTAPLEDCHSDTGA